MNNIQNKYIFLSLLAVPFAVACAGSIPPPTQRLADAQSAERSAIELGANDIPQARLSLKLSQDQTALAQKAMAKNENARADGLLIRARADAELAIAQAREKGATDSHEAAIDDSAAQEATNIGQGAVQ